MACREEALSRDTPVDLAIVGAGVAGLTAALTAASAGARVLLLTKGRLDASASYFAQGGVAAAIGPDDSPELHGCDTLAAGRGLCRESAVAVLTEEAAGRIADLRALGVRFDDDLGLEGGHSRRRILHVDGTDTGRRILDTLIHRATELPAIDVATDEPVVAIHPGVGVVTDRRSVRTRAVVLATGGYAALWSRTTNPSGSVGDGIELAYQSGAAVADLEFVQFHPTVLEGSRLLLSEALRGEGARLVDDAGQHFVDELAPRDVVARAVGAQKAALLDLRQIERARFPSLMAWLAEAGHDPARAGIPVAPAAHFTMGGIVTDVYGRTDVDGLYAVGECACTGVHGANRLASNSLLECLVFGRRVALAALNDPANLESDRSPDVDLSPDDKWVATDEDRQAVWKHAGLVRDTPGLASLQSSRVRLVRLLAQAGLARRESRGGHYRMDFPNSDPVLDGLHTVLRPGSPPVMERWT